MVAYKHSMEYSVLAHTKYACFEGYLFRRYDIRVLKGYSTSGFDCLNYTRSSDKSVNLPSPSPLPSLSKDEFDIIIRKQSLTF